MISAKGGVWCGVSQACSSGLVWVSGGDRGLRRISDIRMVRFWIRFALKSWSSYITRWGFFGPFGLIVRPFSGSIAALNNRTHTDELTAVSDPRPARSLAKRRHRDRAAMPIGAEVFARPLPAAGRSRSCSASATPARTSCRRCCSPGRRLRDYGGVHPRRPARRAVQGDARAKLFRGRCDIESTAPQAQKGLRVFKQRLNIRSASSRTLARVCKPRVSEICPQPKKILAKQDSKRLFAFLPNFARACGRVSVGRYPDKRPDSRQGMKNRGSLRSTKPPRDRRRAQHLSLKGCR